MTTAEILAAWMDEQKVSLLQKYESSGRKASGRFGQSVRIDNKDAGSQMYGASHIWQMVNGRAPNQNQSPDAIRRWVGWAGSTFLKDWVQAKGVSASPYAIAYKIAREGIKVPNANNDGRLLQDTLYSDTAREDLARRIGRNFILDVKQQIQQIWQQV